MIFPQDKERIRLQMLDPGFTFYHDITTSASSFSMSGYTLSMPSDEMTIENWYLDRFDVSVTVTAGFEFSVDGGVTWLTSLTLTQWLYGVTGTLKVRKSMTFAPGTYTGTLTISFPGAPAEPDLVFPVTALIAEYPVGVVYIPDHSTLATSRVMQQFKNAVKFVATIKSIGDRAQVMEDALFPMFSMFEIDAMSGVTLDMIGEIVGRSRLGGQDDVDYRAFIRAAIAINSSQGTLSDIASICRTYLGDAGDLLVAEVYPAGIVVLAWSPTFTQWEIMHEAVEAAAPAGVGATVIVMPPWVFLLSHSGLSSGDCLAKLIA